MQVEWNEKGMSVCLADGGLCFCECEELRRRRKQKKRKKKRRKRSEREEEILRSYLKMPRVIFSFCGSHRTMSQSDKVGGKGRREGEGKQAFVGHLYQIVSLSVIH